MDSLDGEDHDPPTGVRLLLQKLVTVLFLLHLLAGIVLCSCGTMSLKMTAGQDTSVGPPYYIGTFILGTLMTVSGMLWGIVYSVKRHMFRRKPRINDAIYTLVILIHILALISTGAGVVSIVICAKYGLYKCHSWQKDFLEHSCNYTVNFQENHSLAVLELAFLCAATLLALLVIIVTAWCLRILRHRQCCGYGCLCCRQTETCCGDKGREHQAEQMHHLNGATMQNERAT